MHELSERTTTYEGLDQHFDEPLEDSVERLYERGWLPDLEDREEYRPGGFHPVHIGDLFGMSGRYRIIHKLGSGGLATVWLCRDQDTETYAALKIIIADGSREDSPELHLIKRECLDFSEVGGKYVAVPHDYFWHTGPNGRHLCVVLPVLRPKVSALWREGMFEDPAIVSQDVVLQVTRGLGFLHKNGICHGFNELSEEELIEQLGEPNKESLVTISGKSPAPSGPEYQVESIHLDHLNTRFISDQVAIIDFGESYDMHNPPEDLGITATFRAPELLFDDIIGVGCDLWALACTIFEIRTDSPLFENFMDDDDEVIMQMVPLLGELPEPWWSAWEARDQWFKEDGTPLISSQTGKPLMLLHNLEELLSLPSGDDPGGKKNGAGGFVVEFEESKVLANLLSGILKYDAKDRLSIKAVLEQAWFKKY